jgi:hypothetical protein
VLERRLPVTATAAEGRGFESLFNSIKLEKIHLHPCYAELSSSLTYRKNLLIRVGHLLAIHEALRIIFPYDRDLDYVWITSESSNVLFGESPLTTMKLHRWPQSCDMVQPH